MKMPPSPVDNKNSRLLSTEENFQVFKLLGNRCQSLATAVVQVFVTTPPQHLQWAKKDTGVLCFVRDNNRKNYFFRLFCLRRNTMTWEHEMYNNLEYIESRPFFHMFEGEENIVAFNFAQSNEALDFKAVVDQKVAIKRQKEERRARKINLSQSIGVPQPANNIDFGLKQELRKKKRKKNLTKDDIGFPYHFTHVSHVGFDPSAGFDLKGAPPELQQILKKAGVSEKLLRDTDTRNFIYDFISNHSQGNENITPPPAVPPRGPPRPPSSRPAPPPPPYNRSAPPSEAVQRKARPPSPPKNVGSAPPPPPPPPPMNIPAPPPMLDMDQAPQPPYSPKANPEALFESIRNGTNLKSVEERRITPVDDARGDLLSEIRKGIQLKKVDEREIKAPQNASPPSRGNDLASALAKALAERSKMIHSEDDDDGDSSTSNEDEWD